MSASVEKNEKTGLPLIDQDAKDRMYRKAAVLGFAMPAITTLIGYGIAYLIYQ